MRLKFKIHLVSIIARVLNRVYVSCFNLSTIVIVFILLENKRSTYNRSSSSSQQHQTKRKATIFSKYNMEFYLLYFAWKHSLKRSSSIVIEAHSMLCDNDWIFYSMWRIYFSPIYFISTSKCFNIFMYLCRIVRYKINPLNNIFFFITKT